MKKTLIAALLLAALLLVSASASGEAAPAEVFAQERALLDSGTPAERIAQGSGVYILEVAEVSPPEGKSFHVMTPYSGEEPQEILETWDYAETAVRCRVVGSDQWDFMLYFGRHFISRSGIGEAACPDDDFPDPGPGDRLLVFGSLPNGMSSVRAPLDESRADQRNTVVVCDSEGRVTVCLTGTLLLRGSGATPID